MDALERLRQSPLPFAALLGIQFTAATPERVTAELIVRDDLCTRPAILHGGAIMAFADTFGRRRHNPQSVRGRRHDHHRIENKFHRPCPGWQQDTGEATPVHRGRRTMVWQTKITNETGRLVALVTQTQLVLGPPAS